MQSKVFSNWKESSSDSLWFYGIPGAGKTILCSTVIEHIKTFCDAEPENRVIYFYFNFNDAHKQTSLSMLRSLVTQLCPSEGRLPSEVRELYQHSEEGTRDPEEETLIKVLESLLVKSQRTFIIIDALDECREKENMLAALIHIVQMPVNLLLSSRKEKYITEGLKSWIEHEININGQGIDEDIAVYLKDCLVQDRLLRKWSSQVKRQIQDALLERAQGM